MKDNTNSTLIASWNISLQILFHSQQFEELITQLYVNKNVKKFGCYMNTKLQFENELITYQEYITRLKKYQLTLE